MAGRQTRTRPSGFEDRANALLKAGVASVKRVSYERARRADGIRAQDFVGPYVAELSTVVDLPAIAAAKVRIGADPLGGSSVGYWAPIAARYGLDLTVVNPTVDKTFSFMPLDHDGKIRMDCSSPYAMANLVAQRDRFDIAFGNDTDSDRHGVVTRRGGLMNPNHYLAVAISYLFGRRTGWREDAAIGKTLVSSSMIDRVALGLGRTLAEVPVGFKWFVPGLLDGSFGFGGEESAGASFLRFDGSVWTTDKDGILLDSARRRDPRDDGQGPRRPLPRPRGGARRARLHAHRRTGDARAEEGHEGALARRGQGRDRSPATPSRPASRRRPSTARRLAA